MKMTIESTSEIVSLQVGSEPHHTHLDARVWQGTTERGIDVQCLIVRIGAPANANLEQFERELTETPAPRPTLRVFPLRMIL